MNFKLVQHLTLAGVVSVSFSSCQLEEAADENEQNDESPATFQSVTIDASSNTEWSFIDLSTHTVVTEQDDWDIALQRYGAIANTGIELAIVAEQADFYENDSPLVSQFINSTAESELDHLTSAVSPDGTQFSDAEDANAIAADQFSGYSGHPAHTYVAIDDVFFLISSNTGNAFAKLRATQVADPTKTYEDADVYDTAIFELEIAADSTSTFGTAIEWSISTPAGSGEECFDIETSTEIACSNSDWDVKYSNTGTGFGANPTIKLNSGISGPGTAKLASKFASSESAHIVTPYQDVADDAYDLSSYSYSYGVADSQASVFSEFEFFKYGVNGGHSMWPNYRVYAVKTDTSTHFIQFVNYYNDQTESGHITYRTITAD